MPEVAPSVAAITTNLTTHRSLRRRAGRRRGGRASMKCSCLDARIRTRGRHIHRRRVRHPPQDGFADGSPGLRWSGDAAVLRARAWDALVLVLVVGVLFEVLTTDQDVPLELSVPVGLAMTVPLLWGQRRPLVAGRRGRARGLAGPGRTPATGSSSPQIGAAAGLPGVLVASGPTSRRAPPGGRSALACVALVAHQPDDVDRAGPADGRGVRRRAADAVARAAGRGPAAGAGACRAVRRRRGAGAHRARAARRRRPLRSR